MQQRHLLGAKENYWWSGERYYCAREYSYKILVLKYLRKNKDGVACARLLSPGLGARVPSAALEIGHTALHLVTPVLKNESFVNFID